jgi:hypothetical protein
LLELKVAVVGRGRAPEGGKVWRAAGEEEDKRRCRSERGERGRWRRGRGVRRGESDKGE